VLVLAANSRGTTWGVIQGGYGPDTALRTRSRAGYEVLYREFDGGHRVPAAIVDEAFRWWLPG
jgi:predicted esterase